MNYLSVENLSLNYGEKVLFENLSLFINRGDKVALIAKNGTGKTTLLKTIAGYESPSQGAKIHTSKDIQTIYLQQEPPLDPKLSIKDTIFDASSPKLKAIQDYEYCMDHEIHDERLTDAMELLDKFNAWDIEAMAREILGKLQIFDLEQTCGTLSGGQRKRVALAKMLLMEPDFLILDEPTNHLDPDMIEWLEEYLEGESKTLLMVTHDRYFLDRVCNHIVELEEGVLQKFKGNYAYYLEKKQEASDIRNVNIDKAKSLFRKELEWMRRMPQGRGTKAKSRITAFYDTEKEASQKINGDKMQLEIVSQRMGTKILEFRNVEKSFGEKKLVEKFNYKFKRFEKVGIVGKNGVGKSTFLNMILGLEKPDSGEITVGDTISIGYYTQDGIKLNEDKRVLEVLNDVASYIPLKGGKEISASQMLERFLFSPKDQFTYVSKLSGGERRRLTLLMVLMKNPNFLILDEPTNDLDILALNVLEEFLMDFEGCLIVVTHDRYFLDKLAEHIFIFEGDGVITDYNGIYSDFLAEKREAKYAATAAKTAITAHVVSEEKPNKPMGFREQKELKNIEKDIEKLEAEKSKLSDSLYTITDIKEIEAISNKIGEIIKKLEEKEGRWLELSA